MVKGQKERKDQFPKIMTCPSEMVACSMADGYARLTGKPQCVIVHVDVGTQGLGCSIHNASTGRAPVLIFAGLSPVTLEGEMRGSRTEYIHWIQDVPDQKAIVAQYCKYAGEIKSGKNVKQMVNRALQFATSDPQGPVYLCGAREVMEEDLTPYQLDQTVWSPVGPAALPQEGIELICKHLVAAESPLLITGYSGRNPSAVSSLVKLADTIPGLRVLDTGGSDMCFPFDHPGCLGLSYGINDAIPTADFILVVDCDVPWIPTQCKPSASAKIIHIDIDPLKRLMPTFYIPAIARYTADAHTSFTQLTSHLTTTPSYLSTLSSDPYTSRKITLIQSHKARLAAYAAQGTLPTSSTDPFTTSQLCAHLRTLCPPDTIWVIEAVTHTLAVANQIQPTYPSSWLNCGGGGLGWSGGASLGIKLATDTLPPSIANGNENPTPKFICQIVGDGTFLFSMPSSVHWISSRYSLPTLTIVLNNHGWNAPRRSLLLVHPDGEGSKVNNRELNISLDDPAPDYAGIATAASGGWVWPGRIGEVGELKDVLGEAVQVVKGGRSAVVDCRVSGV
ncbi:MAG: hypothetical protein M1834_006045 [Cirrosporium novae-zelandiae]|nr:MAG: hypothetical protein M1834_006045 [Cirrosporium novae-zelandiae]